MMHTTKGHMIFIALLLFVSVHCQTMKQLNEISIKEELPINTTVTFLTDKIPNLDQASEYGLVDPASTEPDLFLIDRERHALILKKRLDFEEICSRKNFHHCIVLLNIAVSHDNTIVVYNLPVHIINIDDNPTKFLVNRTIIDIDEEDDYWFNRTYKLPHAVDADGDLITYSLYLHNWNQPKDLFEFDRKTLLLRPLKKFDREQKNLYLLRLVAKSQNQNDVSIDVIITIKDINDNKPQCQHNRTLFYISQIETPSLFSLNVIDADENENGKLEYNLINSLSGFSIDSHNGRILFNYKQWIYTKDELVLSVNVTDRGKPYRLSTECIVEFKMTFFYDIHLKSYNASKTIIDIDDLDASIDRLIAVDKQQNKICSNCWIDIKTSWNNLFYLNATTWNLYLNLHSLLLVRFLSNPMIKSERLPIDLFISVHDKYNPSIVSTKNYSLILHLNKARFLKNSNRIFIKIHENILLNERISLKNDLHSCLFGQANELVLIDATNTFYMNENYDLIIKKHLSIKHQQNYVLIIRETSNNRTDQISQCSMKVHIHVFDPYSQFDAYPYFSQSFYIVTSTNLSHFALPQLPSNVKYISSIPNEILVNENNASITIRSSFLYTYYSYDFYIHAVNSQIPLLNCSVPVRIYFGVNRQAPRFSQVLNKQSIEILPSKFIYQIQAYDPDINIKNESNVLLPYIEYKISSYDNLEIERYTGRIFMKNFNETNYNFTVTVTDFGQPNRLETQQTLILDLITKSPVQTKDISAFTSTTAIAIGSCILSMIILSIIVALLCACFNCRLSKDKCLPNISPSIHDGCLIDNEYITTTTSLPRVNNREQRIYPTMSIDNQHKLLEQIHLPPPSLYSNENSLTKQEHHRNLSINDINKYLERFEKIYNTSTEHHFGESVGSVV